MNKIKLSVLDFGDSNTPDEDIESLLNYSIAAERFGFTRFWLGEHYVKNTLFSNPEPLIPVIARLTKKISVGVAGLLIRQHSVSRIACSFSLLERMFPKRIDLGIVAPILPSEANIDGLVNSADPSVIFKELINYYKEGSPLLGVSPHTSPKIWHLTSSIKRFNGFNHSPAVCVSKSLFHKGTNLDSESDEIRRLKEKFDACGYPTPVISVAIGCYTSFDVDKIAEYKDHYKSVLNPEIYKMCIIEPVSSMLNRIEELVFKYQTTDIIILNLGRSYHDKINCLASISDIFNLKNASEPQ